MKSVLLVILLALGVIGPAAGRQDENEVVRFDELIFNSSFERQSFTEYANGEENFLKLLLAVDPAVNKLKYDITRREITVELHRLQNRKFLRAKDNKKILLLFEDVNKNILRKYQENTLFPELFNSGIFNCLTASAYYGILLDSLNIPFDFRETYNHVHPVAYPNEQEVKIETTDPYSGIRYFDEKLKVRFVNYLLETKRVSRYEYDTTSVDDLFNRYYLPEKSIGMKELAGLQYMNDALNKVAVNDDQAAFEQIKKAFFLYPSPRVLTVFQFILNGAFFNNELDKASVSDYFEYFSRLVDKEVLSADVVASNFTYLSNTVLLRRSDVLLYDSIYHSLEGKIGQPELRKNIEFTYSLLRGKSYLNDFRLDEAMKLFERAFTLENNDMEVQTLLVTTLAYYFQNSSTEEMVGRIEKLSETFPGLGKNGMFLHLKMTAYLSYAEELFDFGQPENALAYLNKFEMIYDQNPEMDISYRLVGDAYSSAAVYFFKRYNVQKARELLEKGLKIAPDNFELRYRLNSL